MCVCPRQDGLSLQLTNERLYGTPTAEERYWASVQRYGKLWYYYCYDIIKAGVEWTHTNPDVEVVLLYTDNKGDGNSQCYVCDVGGTMAGFVMAISRGVGSVHARQEGLRAVYSFVDRLHSRRTRRIGVSTTLRTQLCVAPRRGANRIMVEKALGSNVAVLHN